MVGFDAGGLSGAELARHASEVADRDRERRQSLEDQQRQIRFSALSSQLQNAQTPEEARDILTGAIGVFGQPQGEGHHPIQAIRDWLGKLTGQQSQARREPWDEQPPVPLDYSKPGPAAPELATTTPQPPPWAQPQDWMNPSTRTPPAPLRPPGAPAGPAPMPVLKGPARPVPPGMKGKEPKADPAVDTFMKYWRSPTQLAEEQDQAKLDLFNQRLDQLGVTDPQKRKDLQEGFLRAEFGMKAPTGHSHFQNYRLPSGQIVSLDEWAPGFTPPPGAHKETSTRKVPGRIIGVDSAKELATDGKEFMDTNGDPIDLSKLHPWEALQPIYSGSEETWQVVDQRMRTVGAGNEITVQPEVGRPQPVGQAPSLGARYPTTSRATWEQAPDGSWVQSGAAVISRGGGGAPAAPGATPKAPGAAAAPVAGAPKGPAPGAPARPTPPGSTPGPAAPQAGGSVEQQVHSQGIMPNIQHMTQRNAAAARKQLPAVTALLGMYGDPQSPGVPSMADFADLANDEHAKRTLGPAFVLLNRAVGSVTDPGKIETLQNAAGWANYQAEVEAQIQRTQGEKMTQRERDYFNAAIAGMADIIGSRGATGQSPAKFSVEAIQNELPLIGLASTTDKRQYLTKLLTISRQLDVGLAGMPDKERAVWWLNKRRGDLEKELEKGSAPGGPMRPVPPASNGKPANIVVKPEDM